ncbi:hypothetical protein F3Y22_tig00112289pilonHSYRG00027 [Hibiscus syriacus]|uniref:HAT C-terminal dimerisation domain-containing protein n=1 Tax=Hibiscus syriacus TaxID=106335 RepID=A0A6A2YBR7_HIBSY|nr:hypothetical protein F3Y22_tig00112289pilonHSYRG00027 [Hibiscus syriacus]
MLPEVSRAFKNGLRCFNHSVSTIASDSAFDIGPQMIGGDRSSLKPKMLQALVCLQDWILASDRKRGSALWKVDPKIIAQVLVMVIMIIRLSEVLQKSQLASGIRETDDVVVLIIDVDIRVFIYFKLFVLTKLIEAYG